ncbi:hypothetical protein [Pedobacter antarcticus]|uniref:hypothetical protein n=1 Tax=Pedobacter antarcticus TaxID=34086 RepID=UPI0029310288|nr:hypothetical protein [Pedobacter antarcticus]
MENNTFDQIGFNSWLDQLEEFLLSIYWPEEEAAEQRSREIWTSYFQKSINPIEAFFEEQSK